MKILDIMGKMNPEQAKAIFTTEGPLLVFAGAGSGKTRVLTYRAAYLVENKKIAPEQILAITFTNKAANEMKERIKALIGKNADGMWAMTFHSMCVRILRKNAYLLGYTNNFSIYDTDDSKSVISKIIKEDTYYRTFTPASALAHISNLKSQNISPDKYLASTKDEKILKKIYESYEEQLYQNNAFDFDDLLLKTVELFNDFPDVLDEYQKQFHYIMVDEYQDTNSLQFLIVSMLAEKHKNICVVGDDDQSIYGFRGADIQNILDFERNYPNTLVIKLEENYRSSGNILNTANAVIKNNIRRSTKKLKTSREPGKKVQYIRYESSLIEASSVIRDIISQACDYKDIAILYRTNAQSRLLEEACIKYSLPYRIVGGISYYQRKEIKDMIAYLKIISNPADAVSLKRIINVPKRNIGDTTIDKIETYAKANSIALYEALQKVEEIPSISKRTKSSIMNFITKIEEYHMKLKKGGVLDTAGDGSYSIHEYLNDILYELGYMEDLMKNNEEDVYETKKENLEELINKVIEFEDTITVSTLDRLLEDIALVSGTDTVDDEDKVTLMTLHSSKGLEYKKVYIVGMEEQLFPSRRAVIESDIEEERRLCYVGITRAIDELILSSAAERMVNGYFYRTIESRFIDEMPNLYVDKTYG